MNWRPRNLRALSRHDPALAQRLSAREADPALELFRSRSGAHSARRAPDRLHFHSAFDPQAQAERSWTHTGAQPGACLLLGVGLGWTALVAAQRLPADCALGLADPEPGLFERALSCLDLSPLFARKRLSFYFGPMDPVDQGRWSAQAPGLLVHVQESVLQAWPGGRAWALEWIKGLRGGPAEAVALPQDAPAWLQALSASSSRTELP